MIAVFCHNRNQFEVDLDPSPRNMLKIINTIDDLRGREFIAVIFLRGWLDLDCKGDIRRKKEAYAHLRMKQPGLFKKQ